MYIPVENISETPVLYIAVSLIAVTLAVLVLPFILKWVEHNLEIFFLLMGILAVTISGLWSSDLIIEALKAPVIIGSIPIGIFQVVLVFGILVFYFNEKFTQSVKWLASKLGIRNLAFLMILFFGLISSLLSVIVTAVLISEIICSLPLEKGSRVKLTVITCFSCGLGAVLTPLGEPLSTILVQKLTGPPFYAGFFFPFEHFYLYVIPGVVALAIVGAIWFRKIHPGDVLSDEAPQPEKLRAVIFRAVKVYIFVAALVLLGEGLKPLVLWYLVKVPAFALFWINSISAVLDNATLTAVEISSTMSISKIIAIIMGLLIAGGMLIPGNIPNIVAAGRLKISMKEWAKIGIPIGIVLLIIYFVVLIPTIF
jgi:predicted cation transporter